MSIISISATKAQKDGAKYLFGPKGESILAVLEALAKAKELRTPHLTGLIWMLKDAEDEELIKFKASPAGKRTIEAAKTLATAKTLVTSIKALRGVKVNSKWVQNHDDVKAAGAEETKTHRATGKGTKPQKGDTLVNPQAPEAETVDNVIDISAMLANGTKPDSSLLRPFSVLRKQPELDKGRYFMTLSRWFKKQLPGATVDVTKKGVSLTQKGSDVTTSIELTRTGWVAKITTKRHRGKSVRTVDIGELFEVPTQTAPAPVVKLADRRVPKK